jgi:hypothetical protein
MGRSENDAILGQDKSSQHPSFFRYPTLKIRKIRRKRPSLKNSLENGDGDCISSTCTLPTERSNIWADDSSRASSRCTYHEPRGAYTLTDSPCISKSSLAEKATLVLSPHISVVSETVSMLAGQQHLWAAVEVCGRLFPACAGPKHDEVPCPDKGWWPTVICFYSESKAAMYTVSIRTLMNNTDTSLKFGYLYDLTIDVLPTLQSSIIQIICQESFPT